jgi:acyl-CoA hydrolase
MSPISLRFLVETANISPGGRVHGGTVMKWMSEAGFACATRWAEQPCQLVYASSIRFRRSVRADALVEVQARLAFTGDTNMHVGVELSSGDLASGRMEAVAECLMVYIALGEDGRSLPVNHWMPETPGEMALASSARSHFDNTSAVRLE